MRVLITPTSLCRTPDAPSLQRLRDLGYDLELNPFGRPMTADELAAALPGIHGVVAGLDDYSEGALRSADALRVIARYGTGVNNVDLEAAARRGITVTRTPGANSMAVAEHTMGLVLSVARGIPRLDQGVRAGEWPRTEGRELHGGTLGVIGFGAIGQLVAERAKGFGMRVIAYDPMLPDDTFAAADVERALLDDLCRRSDVVSVHVPLMPETHHLLDARRIDLLPPDAIIVNTARGGLIDEGAARAALETGALYGVGIDVYETEPPSASPLVGHPRVVATAHSGGHTRQAVQRMTEQSIGDLLAVLAGDTSPNALR